MNTNKEPNYYLVRTIQELVEQGIVGIGWSDFNFAEIGNAEDAIRQINDDYGVSRYGNQIRRFFNIQEGDMIVATLPYAVAIGKAVGGPFFDMNYYSKDRTNQRRVAFPLNDEGKIVTIPRCSFSEAFQRRLRVQGMVVNNLSEFSDEIQDAFASIERGFDHSWVNQLNEQIEKQQNDFKKKLLSNIQSGRTNLQTGGIGLENLMCELLSIEGYKAKVLAKTHFNSYADADVQASRSGRCALVNLLVQVKHHQGYSNAHGIHQLQEIQTAHQGEYDDHERVFVTSASVSDEVLKIAEAANITVIAGMDLADWISEHIDKLKKDTKAALGIYEVPAVL